MKSLKEKIYLCQYCGNTFTAIAKSSSSEKSVQSNSIECPNCNNFLPTWEDKIERIMSEVK